MIVAELQKFSLITSVTFKEILKVYQFNKQKFYFLIIKIKLKMKVKKNRDEFINVKNITIQLTEETSLRMTVTNENRLVVTKVNDNDNNILVKPCVSNQVEIF